jgi:lipid II:glycine glycyltransferase (peptidoglycan interpeptide bridge formation enzyme)
MKTQLINPENRSAYDKFVSAHPLGSIHQLWDWGVFQSQSGIRDRFHVVAVTEGTRYLASALVISQILPFGKCWLYCPRGPLGDYRTGSGHAALKAVFEEIRSIAVKEDAVFLRFDPPLEDTYVPEVRSLFGDLGARPAHAHYQPENTLILDLKHAPEEILKNMKPKGRYNIKVAQKHGVKIRVSDLSGDSGKKDLEGFHALMKETASRDGFSGHPLFYYKKMLEVLGSGMAKLYVAEYDGKILAGMIATYFGRTATYYFGASSGEHRNTMAPYILHWQAINDAKAAGFHYYDFFGIAPEGDTKHPWAKVTDFKMKFGGERVNYMPAQEIVYKPFWYALIKIAKFARGVMRR